MNHPSHLQAGFLARRDFDEPSHLPPTTATEWCEVTSLAKRALGGFGDGPSPHHRCGAPGQQWRDRAGFSPASLLCWPIWAPADPRPSKPCLERDPKKSEIAPSRTKAKESQSLAKSLQVDVIELMARASPLPR
jgi:hypothetical protein